MSIPNVSFWIRFLATAMSVVMLWATSWADAHGEEAVGVRVGPDPAAYKTCVDKGVNYLVTHQMTDGSFSPETGVGITALAVAALVRSGLTAHDPPVRAGLGYLEKQIQPDGGIYTPNGFYKNYETCIAMMCFQWADPDRYKDVIARAEKFVKGIQWDESEDKDPSDYFYGGAGYGRSKRPDLSNTAFLIDALRAVGRGPDDPAIQKALIFVSRCQNLETQYNTTPFASKNPDGGFYYTCAAGGQSMAGQTPTGGLRSYGSMTYAGLKSLIYAGLTADDPRVQAAKRWIAQHYDLDSNPGLGQQGLYYYYHTFAKTMDALGEPFFVDAQGRRHDWRAELFEALAKRQREDGSWVNTADRWMEGDPNLVTAYALLALSYCRPTEVKLANSGSSHPASAARP
ncbi:prenyltransferase/squalene oxidase repeat-containing protein [Thermogutta sp.]|uniref:prenyltransferase/squalene oxidase repeat-containing protein n=1 Tax=Thermogutta sp. TaxID=1962930 RepID=UPI0032209B81